MVRSLSFAVTLAAVLMTCGISSAGDNDSPISPFRVKQGFAISPVKPNLAGKDLDQVRQVGLGSYLVNAVSDCSGCHSFPEYLDKGAPGTNPDAGDPFDGKPSTQKLSQQLVANFNNAHYLAGGQCFGPFMARNLTPGKHDQPEGLTEAEFVRVMRTGEDIHCNKDPTDPVCALGPPTAVLQVMPWPAYHSMTDSDLKAVYAYLTAIPPALPCNTVADGCPGSSGKYVYKSTPTCPNPAPPQ
jgi:hypothetical protein